MQRILEEAGLRLTADQRQQLAAAVVAHEEKEKQKQATDFNSLAHCTQVRCRKKIAFAHHKMALARVPVLICILSHFVGVLSLEVVWRNPGFSIPSCLRHLMTFDHSLVLFSSQFLKCVPLP